MDINTMLRGVDCACGRRHTCDIEAIYIENGATMRLSALCAQKKSILLVADENTFAAAGANVEKALGEKITNKVIFGGKTILIPNEEAIGAVQKALGDTDLIVGVGSGVIQDLCKYVSFFAKLPYMIVATAPSMDGYASDGAAMILKGMKETVAAHLPRAIIADTAVLKDAPMTMIQAGYGDIVGKYSALCDWKLSHAVNGEYLCPYIYDTTYQMIEKTLQTAKGLLKRDEESVRTLTEALMIVGIMMRFAGSSRPASGSEHHLSHFFEIVGIVDNAPYFSHGIDVAYSAVVTASLRETIVKRPWPDVQYCPEREDYTKTMQNIYKSVASGCIALQEKTGSYQKNRLSIYKEKEAEIRKILSETPGEAEICEMLTAVGLDMQAFYDLYGAEKIQKAIWYAKDLKDRYTVLWMHFDLFGSEENGYK